MKVRYGGMVEEGHKPSGSKAKYFGAGAAILVGSGHDVAKESKAAMNMPAAAGTCESIFTPETERRIESTLNVAVGRHSDEIKARKGGKEVVVNFSIGVDNRGRVHVQDAWTTPETDLSPKDITDITGLRFDHIRLSAPSNGNMCSYSMPVAVNERS